MSSPKRIAHQELEVRRLRAAEQFAAGVQQAEVARQLGVTRKAQNPVVPVQGPDHGLDNPPQRPTPGQLTGWLPTSSPLACQ
jgi:hypothetical protein